jgi:hypothetical protein
MDATVNRQASRKISDEVAECEIARRGILGIFPWQFNRSGFHLAFQIEAKVEL